MLLISIATLILSMLGCVKEEIPTSEPSGSKNTIDLVEQMKEVTNETQQGEVFGQSENTGAASLQTEEYNAAGGGPSPELVDLIFELESLIETSKQIDELKMRLAKFDFITEVQFFANSKDLHNDRSQVTKGEFVKGMIIKVFYDDGESWIEKQKE